MRNMQSLARFVALMSLFCFWCVDSHAQQQGELGMNCKGEVSRQPPEANLSCRGWKIKLYKGSTGKEWGLISTKTRDGAIRELESSRKWWRDDDRGYQELWANTSEPICDMCDPSDPSDKSTSRWPGLCDRLINVGDIASGRVNLCTGAKSFIENWGSRVGKAAKQYWDALRLRPSGPFANVGDVLRDYKTAMRDVFLRVSELQGRLDKATDFGEIEAGMNDLLREGNALDRAYNGLPRNARDWLEGRVAVDGLWIGPQWPGDSERQGIKIVQSGNDLKLYEPRSGQFLFQGTWSENGFTTTTERKPTELTSDQVRSCGLSSNVLYANVSLRATLSGDGKSFTLEQVTEKVTIGGCVFGGVVDLGTWYRK